MDEGESQVAQGRQDLRGMAGAQGRAVRASGIGRCLLPSRPPHGEQLLPQLLAGPVQPDLGGGLRDPQLGGDRLVGQVVHIPEHDHRTQPRRQRAEGTLQALARGRRLRACLGVELRVEIGDRSVVEQLFVAVP